jgi:G3E family GTPase
VSNSKTETHGAVKLAKRRTGKTDIRMPVTILTGFLGSGKTTCLNTFLRSPKAAETAILINEFGEIDIDGAVLSANLTDGSKLMTLPNGCVCCAVKEDLADALLVLAARSKDPRSNIRRCIIETTGLADPGAIIRGVGHDQRLKAATYVDQTVTVCAADRLPDQLQRFEEVPRQIGIADRIIITKSDLVSKETLAVMEKSIVGINPLADIQKAINGAIDPEHLFGPREPDAMYVVADEPADHHHHHHNSLVQTFTVHLSRPLDPGRFRDVMSFLIMRHAENLLRVKGIVRFSGDQTPRLLNGVHDVFASEPVGNSAIDAKSAGSIVFIGIDLPEETIRSDLKSCEFEGSPAMQSTCRGSASQ